METAAVIRLGLQKIAQGESLELAHIVNSSGSTPRSIDAYMLIDKAGKSYGTVGGGSVEYHATLDGAALLKNKADGSSSYTLTREAVANIGMICGGDIDVEFRCLSAETVEECARSEELLNGILAKLDEERPVVYLFGGGHVSVETAKLLKTVGFDIVVYDDRAEFVSEERFPQAKARIAAAYDDIFQHVEIKEADYALVMTRGHQCDYTVQKQLLRTKACFIGVIGSHRKLATIRAKLKETDGYDEAALARFFAPIGLQIGAETPEEIAVSIAAELILKRAYRENRRKVREHKTLKLEEMRSI